MKAFVQFLDKDLSGKIGDACGSDGVFILDGRNNFDTMINDAYERIKQLRKIHTFAGFEIRKGTRLENYKTMYKELFIK